MIAPAIRLMLVSVLGAALSMSLVATTPARAATTHAVEIVGFAFSPATLTITAGDTVTWTNLDAVAHTATSTAGAFDSSDLEQGESFSLTFTAAGTYDYLCTPHPSMTGRIVVVTANAATPPPATPAPITGAPLPDVAMQREPGVNLAQILGVALLVLGAGVAAPAATTIASRRVTHGHWRRTNPEYCQRD